jgi:LysR family transcriptional regulator, glycine cleavage system transcriptional activator
MKLPPLNAVRAFEVVARLGGMRQAAEELFVTPGAVSQQIRTLEDHFGLALFERLPRALRLTAAGQEFHAAVTRHLKGIAQAADRLRPQQQQIAITVAPDFASRWLMPRLGAFAASHPKMEVRIDASFAVADLERDGFDLGIRTARSAPEQLNARPILEQRVQPFCSPQYFDRTFRNNGKAGWTQARLLHENQPYDMWAFWFAARRIAESNAEAGLYFSHGLLAIVAAIGGEGVTLQPPEYVEREVQNGALVAADRAKVATGLGYYLVWPKRPLRTAAETFKDWILGEARKGGSR